MSIKQQELKKHVAVIHCANTISLLQRKVSNALLCFAYANLMAQEEHVISIRQLCNLIGYSGNNHQVIKDSLKSLMSTVLEWNIVDSASGEEDWTASTMLASTRIKGGRCQYAYSPRMRELLYSPTMYGKINLAIQARFKSTYGLALYENCVRYKGLTYTRWFSLDVFRKLMGVPQKTYVIFRDLKKRILNKALSEVNAYSDLYVEYELDKEGRKVTAIRFKLSQKEKKKIFFINSDIKNTEGEGSDANLRIQQNLLFQKLKNLGLLDNQISKLLSEYTANYIEKKIAYLEATKSFKEGKVLDTASYLISALKKDYREAKTSADILQIENEKIRLEKECKRRAQEEAETLKLKYEQYISEEIDKAIDKLSAQKLEDLKKEFEQDLLQKKDKLILPRYYKEALGNKMVKACFKSFIEKNHLSLLPSFVNFGVFARIQACTH